MNLAYAIGRYLRVKKTCVFLADLGAACALTTVLIFPIVVLNYLYEMLHDPVMYPRTTNMLVAHSIHALIGIVFFGLICNAVANYRAAQPPKNNE